MEEQMTFEFEKRKPIKGYPELHWTGKRPYTSTQYYPAQLKESYGERKDGWMNKIFWGDNLQVMSHLLKDYRGKVQLIYIDPPFDSNEFNPDAIKYPVVIDSPFNTEMDTEKEELLKAYLLENCEISGQFIMSGIGLDESIPESVGAKRIIIENERYHLLQKEDYNMYKELLETFCEME